MTSYILGSVCKTIREMKDKLLWAQKNAVSIVGAAFFFHEMNCTHMID